MFVLLWSIGLILLYIIGGYFGVRQLEGYKENTEKYRQAWLESTSTGISEQTPDLKDTSDAKPVEVLVGIKINRIADFDLKESGWTADFYIWFQWRGDKINPGETFKLVNGEIVSRELEIASDKGGQRYEKYHVKARMIKDFDASRFPFSDDGLMIQVEDKKHGLDVLRYVADEQRSRMKQSTMMYGMAIKRTFVGTKLNTNETGSVIIDSSNSVSNVHSQFVSGVLVAPPSGNLYIKLFMALFASVGIAFLVFFIKPIHLDPRFGLPVGAFFAAVGNIIYIGSILPRADHVTLVDMVNAIGIITIFLALIESTISLYIEDTMKNERLSRFFDKVSFAVIFLGYVYVNIALPIAASS
jgi:hypothetical protein